MDEQRLILVVEDDEATRAFLLENLAADGFRVAGASSAGEGIRAIEVRRPSLVVLDLALEGDSGLDLLDPGPPRRWPGVAVDPHLPVIVLTGRERRIACAASRAERMTTFQSRRVVFGSAVSRSLSGKRSSSDSLRAESRERRSTPEDEDLASAALAGEDPGALSRGRSLYRA
jgi:CheY-like chemotaxis protein